MNFGPVMQASLALAAICCADHSATGQSIAPESPWASDFIAGPTCLFAGVRTNIRLVGTSGPVTWTLAAANRTLAQGVCETRAAGPDDAPRATVALTLPPLEPGVTLAAELRIEWFAAGERQQAAQAVTFFSRDAWSVQRALLEQARIGLFDPAERTGEIFEQHGIPFARLAGLAAIDAVDEGVVVVGEGVSFGEQRRLAETLLRAAGRGASVLCLAPADGEFAVPQPAGPSPSPLRFELEQADAVKRYDKRFDRLPTIAPLVLAAQRRQVVVRASQDAAGWSWLRVRYPARKSAAGSGQLIVCGLAIIRDWEASPVPRYLFVRLLEDLTARPIAEEESDDEVARY